MAEGGREEAEALVDKPFDVIFFTGSPAVGKKVMAAAAEHLTPVTLELGGRSPVILAPDADVELAAARIAWGKFLNAGQTCVAPDHVWVPEGMAEPFVAALARQITRFYGENPLAGEGLPRIVNRRHFDRLAGLLSGGRIAVGGQTVDINDEDGLVYVDGVALSEPYTRGLPSYTLASDVSYPYTVPEGLSVDDGGQPHEFAGFSILRSHTRLLGDGKGRFGVLAAQRFQPTRLAHAAEGVRV